MKSVPIADLDVHDIAAYYVSNSHLHECCNNMNHVLVKNSNFTTKGPKAVCPIIQVLYQHKFDDQKHIKLLWKQFIARSENTREEFTSNLSKAIEQEEKMKSMVSVQTSKEELDRQVDDMKKEIAILKNRNEQYSAHIKTIEKNNKELEKNNAVLNEKYIAEKRINSLLTDNNSLLIYQLEQLKLKQL